MTSAAALSPLTVATLDRGLAHRLVNALVTADREVRAEKGDQFAEDDWTAREFLWEAPGKWELSLVAVAAEAVAGFWIASEPIPGYVHFHRVLVRAAWRGQGLYSRLGDAAIARARQRSPRVISTFIQETNELARGFHERRGFRLLESAALSDFLRETGRSDMGRVEGRCIVRPDGTRKVVATLRP